MLLVNIIMKRIVFLDLLKFFCIYLVVLGHCIQAVYGDEYFNNFIFKFIYTFHMPLFAFISGFLSVRSVNMNFYPFLKKRTRQIIFPFISWSIFSFLLIVIIQRPEHYMGIIKAYCTYLFWYLKSIWICGILTFLVFKYIKSRILSVFIFFLICIILCFIPVIGNYCWINFLLPFLWLWFYYK